MSEDKIESRRAFLKKLGNVAGASFALIPFIAENLCFSKDALDQFENDLEKIQVKKCQNEYDIRTYACSLNYRATGNCECYKGCGFNFHKVADCECYVACGSNFHRRRLCECSGSCGSNNSKD